MLDIEGLAGAEAFNSNPKTVYLHIPKIDEKCFSSLFLSRYGPYYCLSTSAKLEWIELSSKRLSWTKSNPSKVNAEAERNYSIEYQQDEELVSMLKKA